MSTPLTLESLKAEFDRWRKQKKHAQSRTPTSLKKKAVALLNQYPQATILKALKIPEHRFTSWQGADPNAVTFDDDPGTSTIGFVPLPIPAQQDSAQRTAQTMTFKATHPSGLQWSLEGEFSVSQLSAVLTALSPLPGDRS
jgi:hypothetical protein